jgi:hypothetical protein
VRAMVRFFVIIVFCNNNNTAPPLAPAGIWRSHMRLWWRLS